MAVLFNYAKEAIIEVFGSGEKKRSSTSPKPQSAQKRMTLSHTKSDFSENSTENNTENSQNGVKISKTSSTSTRPSSSPRIGYPTYESNRDSDLYFSRETTSELRTDNVNRITRQTGIARKDRTEVRDDDETESVTSSNASSMIEQSYTVRGVDICALSHTELRRLAKLNGLKNKNKDKKKTIVKKLITHFNKIGEKTVKLQDDDDSSVSESANIHDSPLEKVVEDPHERDDDDNNSHDVDTSREAKHSESSGYNRSFGRSNVNGEEKYSPSNKVDLTLNSDEEEVTIDEEIDNSYRDFKSEEKEMPAEVIGTLIARIYTGGKLSEDEYQLVSKALEKAKPSVIDTNSVPHLRVSESQPKSNRTSSVANGVFSSTLDEVKISQPSDITIGHSNIDLPENRSDSRKRTYQSEDYDDQNLSPFSTHDYSGYNGYSAKKRRPVDSRSGERFISTPYAFSRQTEQPKWSNTGNESSLINDGRREPQVSKFSNVSNGFLSVARQNESGLPFTERRSSYEENDERRSFAFRTNGSLSQQLRTVDKPTVVTTSNNTPSFRDNSSRLSVNSLSNQSNKKHRQSMSRPGGSSTTSHHRQSLSYLQRRRRESRASMVDPTPSSSTAAAAAAKRILETLGNVITPSDDQRNLPKSRVVTFRNQPEQITDNTSNNNFKSPALTSLPKRNSSIHDSNFPAPVEAKSQTPNPKPKVMQGSIDSEFSLRPPTTPSWICSSNMTPLEPMIEIDSTPSKYGGVIHDIKFSFTPPSSKRQLRTTDTGTPREKKDVIDSSSKVAAVQSKQDTKSISTSNPEKETCTAAKPDLWALQAAQQKSTVKCWSCMVPNDKSLTKCRSCESDLSGPSGPSVDSSKDVEASVPSSGGAAASSITTKFFAPAAPTSNSSTMFGVQTNHHKEASLPDAVPSIKFGITPVESSISNNSSAHVEKQNILKVVNEKLDEGAAQGFFLAAPSNQSSTSTSEIENKKASRNTDVTVKLPIKFGELGANSTMFNVNANKTPITFGVKSNVSDEMKSVSSSISGLSPASTPFLGFKSTETATTARSDNISSEGKKEGSVNGNAFSNNEIKSNDPSSNKRRERETESGTAPLKFGTESERSLESQDKPSYGGPSFGGGVNFGSTPGKSTTLDPNVPAFPPSKFEDKSLKLQQSLDQPKSDALPSSLAPKSLLGLDILGGNKGVDLTKPLPSFSSLTNNETTITNTNDLFKTSEVKGNGGTNSASKINFGTTGVVSDKIPSAFPSFGNTAFENSFIANSTKVELGKTEEIKIPANSLPCFTTAPAGNNSSTPSFIFGTNTNSSQLNIPVAITSNASNLDQQQPGTLTPKSHGSFSHGAESPGSCMDTNDMDSNNQNSNTTFNSTIQQPSSSLGNNLTSTFQFGANANPQQPTALPVFQSTPAPLFGQQPTQQQQPFSQSNAFSSTTVTPSFPGSMQQSTPSFSSANSSFPASFSTSNPTASFGIGSNSNVVRPPFSTNTPFSAPGSLSQSTPSFVQQQPNSSFSVPGNLQNPTPSFGGPGNLQQPTQSFLQQNPTSSFPGSLQSLTPSFNSGIPPINSFNSGNLTQQAHSFVIPGSLTQQTSSFAIPGSLAQQQPSFSHGGLSQSSSFSTNNSGSFSTQGGSFSFPSQPSQQNTSFSVDSNQQLNHGGFSMGTNKSKSDKDGRRRVTARRK